MKLSGEFEEGTVRAVERRRGWEEEEEKREIKGGCVWKGSVRRRQLGRERSGPGRCARGAFEEEDEEGEGKLNDGGAAVEGEKRAAVH